MAIRFHPDQGSIVICDFKGLTSPEMSKRRPAIVMCTRFRTRSNLCTVIPCSTTKPQQMAPYHYLLTIDPPLPAPYDSPTQWVKADMIYAVSFDRLFLPSAGKDSKGNRVKDFRTVSDKDFKEIQSCMLHGLGLGPLGVHLR